MGRFDESGNTGRDGRPPRRPGGVLGMLGRVARARRLTVHGHRPAPGMTGRRVIPSCTDRSPASVLLGRWCQAPEQALVRLGPVGRLPAGSDLVTLQRRPRGIEAAVPEPPRDGTPEVVAAAACDGVAGACPAPRAIGLGRAAVGTAPRVHGSKCSCTRGARRMRRASVNGTGLATLDQPGCSVDGQVQGSAGSVTVSFTLVPGSTSAPAAGS